MNETAAEFLGYSREELLSMKPYDIDAALGPGRITELIGDMKKDEVQVFETMHETKGGDKIPVEVSSSLVTYNGEPAILSVARDITERKEMERRQRLVYSSLDQASIEVYWIDPQGRFKYANDIAEERLGYSGDELVEMRVWEMDPKYGKEDWKEQWEELKQKKVLEFESVHETREGDTFPVEITSHYVEYGGEEYEFAFARDITERKRVEEKLKKYEVGVEASDDSIYMIDGNYRYVFANDEHLSRLVDDGKVSRKSWSEVVGEKYGSIHSEEDLKALKGIVERVSETGEPRTEEYEFLTEDRWSSRTYSPVESPESGEIEAVVVVSKDITERKKAEKREEFLHSLLRHDVRNKSQVVQSYLELLEDFDLPEEAREYVKKAEKGSREEMDIIEKVRTLREAEEEGVSDVEICSTIQDCLDSWKSQAERGDVEIITECPGEECVVKGGSLLESVFSNVIENSIQHSEGSKIRVSRESEEDEVICVIEDDGKGIPAEEREDIFKRGYTTDEGRGAGLGMFLVKKILEIYGGDIEVKDSNLGGARFDVHLEKV